MCKYQGNQRPAWSLERNEGSVYALLSSWGVGLPTFLFCCLSQVLLQNGNFGTGRPKASVQIWKKCTWVAGRQAMICSVIKLLLWISCLLKQSHCNRHLKVFLLLLLLLSLTCKCADKISPSLSLHLDSESLLSAPTVTATL